MACKIFTVSFTADPNTASDRLLASVEVVDAARRQVQLQPDLRHCTAVQLG